MEVGHLREDRAAHGCRGVAHGGRSLEDLLDVRLVRVRVRVRAMVRFRVSEDLLDVRLRVAEEGAVKCSREGVTKHRAAASSG
tara:strand:+ start:573 stop:821 length:249 start_codon:yes stop_codon:yes gene_type:complete